MQVQTLFPASRSSVTHHPSSSLPKAPFDPRTHPSRSFTHPVLFPRTLPCLFLRTLPASFIRFHISPPTLPHLIISPLPETTPVTLPTNTLHHPSSRDSSTTSAISTSHFQKLPIERSFKPPLPSLLFTPIFRPPGNPFPPSKSPSHFLADFLNALRAPGEVPCRMSPEVILRLERVGN